MRHLFTAIVTAIEAVAVALATFSIALVVAALMWFIELGMKPEPMTMLSAAASVWGLAHGVPINVELTGQAASEILVADGFGFNFSLIPLGLSALTVWLSARLGLRWSHNFAAGIVILVGATAGFLVASFGLLLLANRFAAMPEPVALVISTLWFAVPAWGALLTKNYRLITGGRLFSSITVAVQQILPRAVRLALVAVVALLGLASLTFALQLISKYPEVMRISQMLQLDLLGTVVIFLVQLAFLPTFIIWALAWLSGAGFSLGIGSVLSPFEELLGPLPLIPIFGALPNDLGQWGFLVVVLGTATVAGAVFLVAQRPEYSAPGLAKTLAVVALTTVLAGLSFLFLMFVARGAIGPDRLQELGPDITMATLALTVETLVGTIAGVFLAKISTPSSGISAAQLSAQTDAEALKPRIASPENLQDAPWFRKGDARPKREQTQASSADPDEPLSYSLDEEQLIEEYSWESLTNKTDSE